MRPSLKGEGRNPAIPKKNGKALALDTPIPTPSGWTTMSSLKVGDYVFGSDGKPVRVVAATGVMQGRPCCEVRIRNCQPIIADECHQWVVSVLGKERVVTTGWLRDTLSKKSYRPVIHTSLPVECERQLLPIDPYVFGAWLGDGWSSSAAIIAGDRDADHMQSAISCRESVSSVQKYGYQHTVRISLAGGTKGKRFVDKLRSLGVFGDKHIPAIYLKASREQREELLRGIMDTDGCAKIRDGRAICALVTKSESLSRGYSELLSSLGVPHSKKLRTVRSGRYEGKAYWNFTFTPPPGMQVFSLPRKQRRLDESQRKTRPSFWFESVEDCESVPVRCIQVESPDGVFLAGRQFIPTHNSTLLSGISLYLTVADGEPAAECFGAATSREQAGIVYKQMAELVRSSPYLSKRLEVIDSRKTIACVPTNSFWKVISSDSHRAEGLNIHSLCYDELHSAKDRKLWDAIRYGGIARSQSLVLAITTAGFDRSSICYEQHEHALKVMQDPTVDPQYFAYIAAASPEDDYRDPEVWKAANPSFGVTMDEESFKADVREAEQSPARLSSFLRYRLNVWVAGTEKFVNLTQWERCKGSSDRLDSSRIWHCGLDLAQTWDVNAFVAVSKAHDETFDVLCKFWIPADNAETRRDEVPYIQWSKDPRVGLTLTPGDTCDYEFIKRDILKFCKERTVRRIATDPYNSHYLVQQLQAEGIDVIGFSQNFSAMNTPTRALDSLISQGRLRTNDNPCLNWMAGNCTVKTNADGYIKIAKPSPMSPARVDGMIALVMALALASDAETAQKTPDPEIIVL